MKACAQCHKTVQDGDERKLNSRVLCEDCYIDELMPKMQKSHYNNSAEFMQRLKDSYSVRKQQNH